MSTGTRTATYTIVDIRKTFEGFETDLRTIARRTEKWELNFVENITEDIVKYAESKYLNGVDVALVDSSEKAIRATKYNVTLDGKTMKGDRAGRNNWPNIPNTKLKIILNMSSSWHNLTKEQQLNFEKENGFNVAWTVTSFDTSYSHLTSEKAQLYGSNGYELSKTNFK